jgi:predicted Zn finger-like uncharacterized protein
MRIKCPSCSATYDVPDTLLQRPRTVRCAQCGVDWEAEPIDEDALPASVAETEHETAMEPAETAASPEFELAAHDDFPAADQGLGVTPLSAIERLAAPMDLSPRIRRHDRYLTAAWAGSFAVLAALGVAGYTKRDVLMREWPASKRVYSTLGLAPVDAKTTEHDAASGADRH